MVGEVGGFEGGDGLRESIEWENRLGWDWNPLKKERVKVLFCEVKWCLVLFD